MNKQWRAGLLARFGHDPYPFSVIVEGKDKNEAIKYINKHYPNASIVEIEEDVDDLNMDDLYRDLKGVSPVEERNEDDEEYDSDIPTEIIDYAKEIHRKNPKFSYKEIVMTILDDPQHSKWFKKSYHGNEFDFRQELEEIIREKGVEENKTPKIQKSPQSKASLFLCNECAKTFRANENKCPTCGKEAESVIKEEKKLKDEKEEELPVEKPEKDETVSAEVKVEGQEKLAPEVKADDGGEVKDKDTKNESKVKESLEEDNPDAWEDLVDRTASDLYKKDFKDCSPKEKQAVIAKAKQKSNVEESNKKKVDEQSVGVSEVPSQAKSKDPSKRTIVAKGLADKYEAERIASSKKGSVVSDDEDPKKFMVVVKEAKINEATNDYSVEADLDVTFSRHVPDWDIEHPRKVDVYFNIEEEHRSWGIKDVSIYVTKPVNVPFVLVKWGEEEDERFEKEVTVPTDKITYEWDDSAGIFSIPSFQVIINEKGEVEAAVAYCGYWKP